MSASKRGVVMETIPSFPNYLAQALKRTKGRVVVEIASSNPPDRPRTYLVILWEIDTVTIRIKDVANQQEARDFLAAC